MFYYTGGKSEVTWTKKILNEEYSFGFFGINYYDLAI